MKKTRVFQKVENKRIVSGTFIKYLGTVLLFLFLLPYIITSLFHNIGNDDQETMEMISRGDILSGNVYVGNVTAAGNEKIPLEIYLIDKLSRSINTEYESETLKAQAVLLRTALIEQLWKNTGNLKGEIAIQDDEYGYGEMFDICAEAVYATEGVYLIYKGEPAKASYFAVSNGKTRKGTEVLGTEEYPYLDSVICGRDFLAEKFTGTMTLGRAEFLQAWEKATKESVSDEFDIEKMLITRDSSNYITQVSYGETSLSGEECRVIWGLDSACFQIEEENSKIHFTVKGVGHGLGMSQFAANEMAKSESDYIEILEYFFPETQLTKIE